jgi:hypothetical protein
MSETLGCLVDRLSICNIKIFMAMDVMHKAAAAGTGVDAETVQKLVSLNLERNRLMTSLDRCLKEAVSSGTTPVDDRVKIL